VVISELSKVVLVVGEQLDMLEFLS